MHEHMDSDTQPVDLDEQHQQQPQDERLRPALLEASHRHAHTEPEGAEGAVKQEAQPSEVRAVCGQEVRPQPSHTKGVDGGGASDSGVKVEKQEEEVKSTAAKREESIMSCTVRDLPLELVSEILSILPTKDLLVAMRACRTWHEAALCSTVWRPQCDRLWKDKVYVPRHIRELKARGKAYDAFKLALQDLARRRITREEMTSFQWSFRFKEECGGDWLDLDPWYAGRPPRVIRFRDDGILTGFELADFTWRFTRPYRSHPDLPDEGVRIHVFPMLFFRRHPENWGWIGESAWTQITSFPMPPRGASEYLETPQVTVEMQVYEIVAYNLGMDWANMTPTQKREVEEEVRTHAEEVQGEAEESTSAGGQTSSERTAQTDTPQQCPSRVSEALHGPQKEHNEEAAASRDKQGEQDEQAEAQSTSKETQKQQLQRPLSTRSEDDDDDADDDDDDDREQSTKRARTTSSARPAHQEPKQP